MQHNLQLKSLRKRAGFNTQADLAQTLGVNPRTYASWERGEVKLTLGDAQRIADVLGCSLDELAGRAEPADRRPSAAAQDSRRNASPAAPPKSERARPGSADADRDQTEIVRLFNQLDEPRKGFLLEAAQGLAAASKPEAAVAVTSF